MGDYVTERLGFDKHHADWGSWRNVVSKIANPHQVVRIALCGKYAELADSYVSVNEALRHAGGACVAKVEIDWIETELFESQPNNCSILSRFDGVLVPGGFGSRGTEGKIAALSYAREKSIPTLGICFGFQMAVVEFCRHIGLKNASSTEMNPKTAYPVIDLMPEQIGVDAKGATMRLGAHEIQVSPNTLAAFLYGKERIFERHRHRYEVNPTYIEQITKSGGAFSGKSLDGRRMEIFELPEKYFYMATQFHAEFKSRPAKPSPPYYGLIKAALDKKLGKPAPELAPVIRETTR
jgi:CTP synthase